MLLTVAVFAFVVLLLNVLKDVLPLLLSGHVSLWLIGKAVLLLLPFAGRVRGAGRKLGRAMSVLLLVVAVIAATAGLSGCGSSDSGIFTQPPQTYTLTVTGTSGSLTRSTNLTLTVE